MTGGDPGALARPCLAADDLGSSLARVAEERGDELPHMLARFAFERFLYRLGRSRHASAFAVLDQGFRLGWTDAADGARDREDPPAERAAALKVILRALCRDDAQDGTRFDAASVRVRHAAGGASSRALRAEVDAVLPDRCVHLPLEVIPWDAGVPLPTERSYPTLLDLPPPRVHAPTPEVVAAEKVLAIVEPVSGVVQLSDLFEVWSTAVDVALSGVDLTSALRERRRARRGALPLPSRVYPGSELEALPARAEWRRIVARAEPRRLAPSLRGAIGLVERFIAPVLKAAAAGQAFEVTWRPGHGWER